MTENTKNTSEDNEKPQDQAETENDAPTNQAANDKLESATEKEALEKEIQALKAAIDEAKDRYMRLAAEFDNFKKRNKQELEQKLKFSDQPFAEAVVGCMDDLELALGHLRKETQVQQPTIAGLEMALSKFYTMLKGFGVEKIMATGQTFDPNFHEALSIVESNELAHNQIAEEFQTGYLIHDRVLRPAKVKVVKRIESQA